MERRLGPARATGLHRTVAPMSAGPSPGNERGRCAAAALKDTQAQNRRVNSDLDFSGTGQSGGQERGVRGIETVLSAFTGVF